MGKFVFTPEFLPGLGGEYEVVATDDFNGYEWRSIKKETDLVAAEFEDALAKGDALAWIGFAAVPLLREKRWPERFVWDSLFQTNPLALLSCLVGDEPEQEDDADPPAEESTTVSSSEPEPSENSSGESSATPLESQDDLPSSTGVDLSDIGQASDPIRLVS